VVNLLDNGRQATIGGAPVELRLDLAQDRLVIEVRDCGAGIDEGDEEKIFEPFFTKRVKGTGLGLALAKRIVEEHNGTITARNQLAGGAVVRIEIPRR
jgi:signal transduction histidine kinase